MNLKELNYAFKKATSGKSPFFQNKDLSIGTRYFAIFLNMCEHNNYFEDFHFCHTAIQSGHVQQYAVIRLGPSLKNDNIFLMPSDLEVLKKGAQDYIQNSEPKDVVIRDAAVRLMSEIEKANLNLEVNEKLIPKSLMVSAPTSQKLANG